MSLRFILKGPLVFPKFSNLTHMKNLFVIPLFTLLAISAYSSDSTFVSPPSSVFDHDSPHALLNPEGDDTYLLLAHKWINESLFLDLMINGVFEAKIKEENIYGLWEISSDQNNLTLYNDPSDEETFKYEYSISYVSFHLIKLIDTKGNEISLSYHPN